MTRTICFCFILLGAIFSQNMSATPVYNNYNSSRSVRSSDTSAMPDYGNLNIFWSDFKKYSLKLNVKKLAEMTYFKFMNQNNMLSKEEFLTDFSYGRKMKGFAKAAAPKYIGDKEYDYDTQKYLGRLYSSVVDGTAMYFCKIKGKWKFTGISYGE